MTQPGRWNSEPFLRAWNACGVRTAATFYYSLGSLSRPRPSTPRRRPRLRHRRKPGPLAHHRPEPSLARPHTPPRADNQDLDLDTL